MFGRRGNLAIWNLTLNENFEDNAVIANLAQILKEECPLESIFIQFLTRTNVVVKLVG